MRERGDFFITLYTDASVRPLQQLAQVAWRGKCSRGGIEGRREIEYHPLVARAEMYAIYHGIEAALINFHDLDGFFVNSDNLQCVQSFWFFIGKKPHPNVKEPFDKIMSLLDGRWLRTKHVKAHTGGKDVRSWMNRQVDHMTRRRG